MTASSGAWQGVLRHGWLLGVLGLALLVGELPLVLSLCCAPPGATGLGTAWFVNDFAQYESAMRQGAAQAGWLIHDPFTAEPHAAALMFPLYVGLGKLSVVTHLNPEFLEQAVAIAARALLVLGLWRFCRAFTADRTTARWAFGLALFASGFELIAALAGGRLYTGNWSYETNTFGLLFAAPHVPLAMAATLEMARDGLRPHSQISPARLLKFAALAAGVALLHPFHVPVLLAACLLAGCVFWRSARGPATLALAVAGCLAALPVLWPTISTFNFDPFWLATYSSQNQLPSPPPHELLVDLGPTFLLAVGGAIVLRGRVAPFGVLLWVLISLMAMYAPVPYQRRLSFGLQPALAVLAATTLLASVAALGARRAGLLRLGVVAVAGSATVLVFGGIVASGFNNAPLPIYRSTTDLDAAANWLAARALPGEVILADWQTSNYLAPRTSARMFGGHPVATLHPEQKQAEIAAVFAHPTSLVVAGGIGVQWLVFGPDEASLQGPPEPDFESGAVRVYRVRPA